MARHPVAPGLHVSSLPLLAPGVKLTDLLQVNREELASLLTRGPSTQVGLQGANRTGTDDAARPPCLTLHGVPRSTARQLGVIVPREYIVYDARSSEDLNPPGIQWLRHEIIASRRVSGIIVPFQLAMRHPDPSSVSTVMICPCRLAVKAAQSATGRPQRPCPRLWHPESSSPGAPTEPLNLVRANTSPFVTPPYSLSRCTLSPGAMVDSPKTLTTALDNTASWVKAEASIFIWPRRGVIGEAY